MAFLAGLGWLGWSSLRGEEAIEERRLNLEREGAADLIAAKIQQSLTDIEGQLARLSTVPEPDLVDAAVAYSKNIPDDGFIVVFSGASVQAYPSRRLLYYPALPLPDEHLVSSFATGEAYEDREDFRSAIAYFEELKTADDVRTRGGALVRLARNQKKAGRLTSALATWSELAQLGDVPSGAGPSDLVARRRRCELLQELGRSAELASEARALENDLNGGRWQLTRETYETYSSEVRRWLTSGGADLSMPTGPGARALSLAESVNALWEQWYRDPRAQDILSLRRSLQSRGRHMLVLGRGTADRYVALVGGPDFLKQAVLDPLVDVFAAPGVSVALEDGTGQTVASHGHIADAAPAVSRTMVQTRLLWGLRVVSANASADRALSSRGGLLAAGLSFVALVVVVGTYFSARAMAREMKAARLQSDFIAAVSHEFRTPLTLLRQFSDMLAEGRVASDDERAGYYAALQRGTRRLTRLVENLLDFQRMEAGSQAFKLEPLSAKEWIEELTAEFQEEVRGQGYGVEVDWEGPATVTLRADATVLGRALWNLLDNAVKYSPVCKTIWVNAKVEGDRLTIGVRDRGIGVPVGEQHAIFDKFVRGSSPGGHAVKGTGLGLALVEQIVRAHGGTVRLESRVGEGSTFWISLPAQAWVTAKSRSQWPAF